MISGNTQTRAVGIDLGTTYSAVAYLDDRGRSAMVRNAAGEVLTPSVVLFDDAEVIVGKEAKKFAALRPDCVAECAKRDMGEPHYSRPIRGRNMPAQVIQACILRQLHDEAVAKLGAGLKTVITVPAYFDEARRRATAQAGEMAGIDVLDIVNEPTAAALSFGESLGYLTPSGNTAEPIRVLVYDLGGGTFDATVIELEPGRVRTLATDGDVRLGGRDWDEALLQYLADEFSEKNGVDPRQEPAALAELLVAVEEAKRTLSTRSKASVTIRTAGKTGEVSITVAQFEDLTEPLLEHTSLTTRHVLAEARMTWHQIDRLLLVGGATRMPMVARMLERLSGKRPDRSVHPDEAVARGAAIFAGYLMSKGERFKAVIGDDDLHLASDEMWTKRPLASGRADDRAADVPVPAKTLRSTAEQGGIVFEPVDPEDAIQPTHGPGSSHAESDRISKPAAAPISATTRDERQRAPNAQPLTPLPPTAGAAANPSSTAEQAGEVPTLTKAAPNFTVTDVNAHSLGIEGIDQQTYRRENVVLIPRNTPLPARVRHKFVTKEEGQRTVVVRVLEGENSDPQQCSQIGRAVMRHLPGDLPRGWPIYVNYEFGTNGRLAVHANVPGTDRKVAIQLEHERGLSDEGVRKWRKVLEKKKGFDAFESMLDEVIDEAEVSTDLDAEAELPPAAESLAENDVLPASGAATAQMRRGTRGWIIGLTGFVISAVLGLTLGYYLLALYTPKGNFLNLSLPGLPVENADANESSSD